MNILKKIVAVLLTVCLLFGMVPMSVSATETDTKVATTSTEDSDGYRILHLDCGRKYFTKDWIIALINEMTSAGYTHLELAFGNDGLRFLLDDMSVTANGTTYSSANVTAVIHAGNEAYYDAGDVDELTQNEMDAIIAYANSVGIEIIPLLNTPGHMDTIITAMTKLGFDSPQYSSSARTVDVADTKAVAFTQALVFKYMDYFARKGCKNFNIGADEYANDTGNPQFSALITYGLYDEYITYLNTLAEYAVNKGMTPMAFNDGIYYNHNTSNGTINENIMVCYWSSGWSSYNVASASYLANKGFEMINTHGDYYFVLTSNGITNPSSTALNFDNETFMNSTIKNPAGSMFCIWCDAPGIATETEVAAAVRITLRKMAAAMNDTTTYSEEVVVGGFNADGTINTGSGSDDDETSELVTLTENEVTVTAYDLIGLNVTEATAPTIAGAKNVLAWDMIPFTDDGNYTGSATVSVPVPTGWNTADMGAFVVNDDGTVELLKGTYSNGNYAFTMPHFSVGGIYDEVVLSDVEPLKIEYWITNGVVEDPDTNLNYIEISAEDAYSENGIVLSDTLPEKLQREGRNTEYWQAKLLDVTVTNDSTSGTEEQTRYSGDDETLNTKTFTRVRYWNNEWQVLVGTEWTIVDRTEVTVNTYNNNALTGTTTREKNQLVAYYMEVININNANGTTELHVNAADWGFKSGENWGYWTGGYTPCTVTVQIVYEDGTTNPSDAFDDLLTKTLVYGYWTGGRGLGTMIFDGGDAYDIYKVTAETGDAGYTNNLNGFTINSLTWDGNEETVWSDDPSQSVSIGNPARNPSYEEPKDNLTWNTGAYNKNNAILVRVYVKAVETEDTLTVVYYDEKFGDTLYSYNINVKSDVTFNDSIVNLVTDNVEQPAYFVDADGNTTSRYNVTGYGIRNALDVIQKFQTDLTQVPEAVGKYNSALYSYTGSEISEDGKTLYLYYNINTSVLKPNFVVDFGLPITFNLSDVTNTPDLVKTVTASARYGTVSYDSSEKTFTYTPTQILQNIDVLSINILFDGATAATTTNVGVTPATTVYYEESFLTWDSNWYGGNAAIIVGNQTKEVLGEKKNNFGYDPVYANTTAASNETNASTSTISATATFTFTGDGIQVFANSTESTGYVAVQVKNSSGAIVNMAMVDTVVDEGTTDATSGQSGKMYGLPIVSLIDLKNMPHDTYTVTITKIMDNKPVYIDGIRVFNTMEDSTIFAGDLEDDPNFYELRDMVLNAIGVAEDISVDYKTMYEQVYDAVEGATALITDESVTYGNSDTIQDLLDNGPKNEVYLYAGQTLTFKVSTNRVMQIGMKAPQGATTASISVDGGTTTTSQSIDSSVDMFYTLADKAKNETKTTYTVQIENTGSGILSITELKICDDPNATFVPFTEDEIKNIMCGKPEETEDQPAKEEDKEVTPDKPAVTFKDIKEGSFYYDSVYWAVRKDITQGIGDSLFNPEGTCTRAQVVTFLWRAAGEPKPETTKNPFVDVEEGAYYYDAVLWAYENGITLGLDEEHFDPEGACTRAQVVTFLWRVAEKPKAETAKNPFEDVKKDDYYYDAVLWAYKNGITNGISDTQFQIDGTCKRAQAVTFLYRMYE